RARGAPARSGLECSGGGPLSVSGMPWRGLADACRPTRSDRRWDYAGGGIRPLRREPLADHVLSPRGPAARRHASACSRTQSSLRAPPRRPLWVSGVGTVGLLRVALAVGARATRSADRAILDASQQFASPPL